MEARLFMGEQVENRLKADRVNGGLNCVGRAVIDWLQKYFISSIDEDAFSLATAGYGPENVFKLKLEIVFDEKAKDEARKSTVRDDFNPAEELLPIIEETLLALEVPDLTTLIIEVDLRMVSKNWVYRHLHFQSKF